MRCIKYISREFIVGIALFNNIRYLYNIVYIYYILLYIGTHTETRWPQITRPINQAVRSPRILL